MVWGAIAEYGLPPQEGLMVEMWSTENKSEETATFRFWVGKENKNGKILKGRVMLRDELARVANAG